ncbi:uncharacterized protein LOC143282128 isoform X4 [Babylonia areolata]|uniref:uncharacterized protein LOC143282128 isoform X4 n=1 Tax=Babylonia areolata TaxID=304850 RepID=UPI003FD0B0AC
MTRMEAEKYLYVVAFLLVSPYICTCQENCLDVSCDFDTQIPCMSSNNDEFQNTWMQGQTSQNITPTSGKYAYPLKGSGSNSQEAGMTTCEFNVYVPLRVSFDYIITHHDNHLQVFRQCSEEEGQDFPYKPSDQQGLWHNVSFTLGPCHSDTADGRVVFRGSAKHEPSIAVDNIVIRPCPLQTITTSTTDTTATATAMTTKTTTPATTTTPTLTTSTTVPTPTSTATSSSTTSPTSAHTTRLLSSVPASLSTSLSVSSSSSAPSSSSASSSSFSLPTSPSPSSSLSPDFRTSAYSENVPEDTSFHGTSLASSASPSSAEPSDTSPPPSSPPHSQDTSRKTTTPETGAGTDSRPRTPSPSPHPTSSPTPSHTSPPVTSPPVTSSPVTSTHPTSSPTPSHPSSPVTSTPVTSPTVTSPQPSSANSSRNTRNTIIIIGSSVGGAIFLILVVAAAIIIFTKVRGKGKDKALHKDRLIDNELPSPGSPPNNCTEATDFPFFKDFCRTGPDHHFFFRHHKAQYESFEMMPFHFNGHGQPWLYGRLQEDRQTSTDRSHDYQHNWTDIEMPAADYPGHDDETRRAWNGTVEEQLTPTPTEHTDRQHPSHRHTQGNHSHRPQHVHRELRGPGGRDFSEGMKDISLYRSVPHRVIALPDPEHPSVHIPRVWLNSTKPSSS